MGPAPWFPVADKAVLVSTWAAGSKRAFWISTSICTSLSIIYLSIHPSIYMSTCLHMGKWIHVHIYKYICVYMYVYLYMQYMHVCIYIYIHMVTSIYIYRCECEYVSWQIDTNGIDWNIIHKWLMCSLLSRTTRKYTQSGPTKEILQIP